MAKKLLSDYLQGVKTGSDQESYDALTNREREVLKLIAEGHTNQETAELLVLSIATVRTHRAHIMSKLGLRSPVELVKYALRRGFISLDT
jgi:two-component system response regulator NreC